MSDEGSPGNPVQQDPWELIVGVTWGPTTGGGSGARDGEAQISGEQDGWAALPLMGSSATGAATTDGNGVVTLPNNGTYQVSLAIDGVLDSGSGTIAVGLIDVDTGAVLAQASVSGTASLETDGSFTISAPGGPPTFRVETMYQISGAGIVGMAGVFTKVS